MSEKLKRCEACNDPFEAFGTVIVVNDEFYHGSCVELYPIGYVAMRDGEPLGETENDDGTMAYDVFDEGEYLEDAQ